MHLMTFLYQINMAHNFFKNFCLILLFLTLGMPIAASALPLAAEIEVDRLLQAASVSLDKGNYAEAVSFLENAKNLNVPLPANFQYHYGRALFGMNRLSSAEKAIENYLVRFGKKAKYYSESLSLMTKISVAKNEREQKNRINLIEFEKKNAEREAEYMECVEEKEQLLSNVDNMRSALANLQQRIEICSNNCAKSHCQLNKKFIYTACAPIYENIKEIEGKIWTTQEFDKPDSIARYCRKNHVQLMAPNTEDTAD